MTDEVREAIENAEIGLSRAGMLRSEQVTLWAPQVRILIEANKKLETALRRARLTMGIVDAVVTSHERDNRPIDKQWWADELAAVDAALNQGKE